MPPGDGLIDPGFPPNPRLVSDLPYVSLKNRIPATGQGNRFLDPEQPGQQMFFGRKQFRFRFDRHGDLKTAERLPPGEGLRGRGGLSCGGLQTRGAGDLRWRRHGANRRSPLCELQHIHAVHVAATNARTEFDRQQACVASGTVGNRNQRSSADRACNRVRIGDTELVRG
jgi:hypothetical protein